MAKPICLITGATDGVGKATAAALARKGFTLVLAARSESKAERVRREMAAGSGAQDIEVIVGDLASLEQVGRLAETFLQRHRRLDLLINNAGVFATRRTLTEDGFETNFQVNYLAHFLLTLLLLEALKRSEQGRIINLSSNAYAIGQFDPDNLQGERRFSSIGGYAASKLFILMSTIELAARLRGTPITANAVHPGFVNTNMLKGATGLFKPIAVMATPIALSPEKGAATSIHVATSPDVSGVSGRYFAGGQPRPVRSKFNTATNRARLWAMSLDALTPRAPALWELGLKGP
jgi:NAD(P)-dependent dehydrogenase (short-subunit alcohol dehydrogenase family)